MITKLLSIGWGWIGAERRWLVLLAIAGLGAWLYAHMAIAQAQRDALRAFADRTCAAAGAPYVAGAAKCEQRIQSLAAFERDTNTETARILAEAIAERDGKTSADSLAARHAAEQARDAALNMEKADAKVGPDDQVNAAWFDALNHAGGLRPPKR